MKLSLITAALILSIAGCGGKADSGFASACDTSPVTTCPVHNVWTQVCNPWLLTEPKITLIFWGKWWIVDNFSAESGELAQEWQTLGNDPNFYLPMQEYGIGTGSLNSIIYSYYDLPDTILSDDDIITELNNEINNLVLPPPSNQTIYLIMLPPNTTAAYDQVPKFGGHHYHGDGYTYATAEYGNTDFMSIIASHEIFESCTDPDTVNGYLGGPGETEIADDCTNKLYSLDGYLIQKLWSQSQCKCIP